jgi:glyoxylase-like metal-dependent hydrolase (beta-lactamase superfamily II)
VTDSQLGNDWTSPGVFEVADGVYRIPLPLPNDGLRAVNVYALCSRGGDGPDEGIDIIDAGWALEESRAQLQASLSELGYGLKDIRRFLVTHVHRDHYSQAVALRRDFGIKVSLGIGEQASLELMTDPDQPAMSTQLAYLKHLGAGSLVKHIAAMHGTERHETWEFPDQWFENGDVVTSHGRELDVVPTPGHTHGHVVFHDLSGGLLFAGDHVLPTITPSIGFESALSPNPLGSFLTSLAVVRDRPDALLLPAHGPIASSVHQRVDQLIAHHGARLDDTEAVAVRAGLSAFQVAQHLNWTRHEKSFADLDSFNQMLATTETAAHLDVLIAQGRLTVYVEDSIRRYLPPA